MESHTLKQVNVELNYDEAKVGVVVHWTPYV